MSTSYITNQMALIKENSPASRYGTAGTQIVQNLPVNLPPALQAAHAA
jgi:hypothetical protein